MRFRNKLEKDCFLIAKKIVASSGSVEIKHNEKLSTDWLHKRSQITFSGLPSKEVDVLSLNLSDGSNIYLLVSCKNFKSRCLPTHVQEWGNVVDIFNQNAIDKTYFGAVVSSKGFTSGCETWATQNNLGIIPPYKGESHQVDI